MKKRVQSVWRTLLVGNEYNELTTVRWVFFDLTLFFTGFLLVYAFLISAESAGKIIRKMRLICSSMPKISKITGS